MFWHISEQNNVEHFENFQSLSWIFENASIITVSMCEWSVVEHMHTHDKFELNDQIVSLKMQIIAYPRGSL